MREVQAARPELHQPHDGGLELARVELRRRGGGHDPRPLRRIELAVRQAEGVTGEDADRAMVDDGLVMQGVAGCVHALEVRSPRSKRWPSCAMTRRSRAIGRISPYSREYSSSPYTARVPAISLGRIDHVRRAARVHHRGGARQFAHQRTGAAGMVEVHVREEQVFDRVALDAELGQRREYQRNRGVRAGVDDGGA
jgi:hypothetical protein